MLGIREGGYQDSPSKTFCLTLPKILVGELFQVSDKREYRKILCIGGGGAILHRKMFCLILPKTFVGDTSLFDKISGIEKFFA